MALFLAIFLGAAAGRAPTQTWSDDKLVEFCTGFQSDHLTERLEQVGRLLDKIELAYEPLCARIHGDHREYILKIRLLMDQLGDERWSVREEAERTLIEVGARAKDEIAKLIDNYEVLEQSERAKRIVERINSRNQDDEVREIKLLRGLVLTAQYLQSEEKLLQALRSALGHTDTFVVEGAIRALGRLGGDEEAAAVMSMIDYRGGMHRSAALGALPQLDGTVGVAHCLELLAGDTLSLLEIASMVRDLRQRENGADIVAGFEDSPNPILASAAAIGWNPPDQRGDAPAVRLTLADRSHLTGTFRGFLGDTVMVDDPVTGLKQARIPLSQCGALDFHQTQLDPSSNARLFLNQGSLISADGVVIEEDRVEVSGSVFGTMELARLDVQGVALDPDLDRLVGGSTDYDRVRLTDNSFINGALLTVDGEKAMVTPIDGETQTVPIAEVAGLLLTRPRDVDHSAELFARIELDNGDRILGHIVAASATHIAVVAPELGKAVLPTSRVINLELGVGGGALWGFTLIADYFENRVLEIDEKGNVTFVMEDVLGAWDVECLDNGNLLVTEYSVSRVQEIDRQQNVIWVYEDLKNPYDADRLPNGNTLIADTFSGRVIEIKSGTHEIIWTYDHEIRPFDADRLPNGNTLICDMLEDRVIEVSPSGEIVWEATNLPNAHDADRLPNGNTLVTLRTLGRVVEIDRDRQVVFELQNLVSPGDADRLPNGHTLTAEESMVREFDRLGNEVWRHSMAGWPVEVNRY